MPNYRSQFIFWYHEIFKNHDLYKDMDNTTEDSPWHRERTVGVHTDMVVSQYLCRSPLTWSRIHLCGAIACAFHDVGKPAALQWKESPERGKYKVFYQHEQISARMWEDYIMFWTGSLMGDIKLTSTDVYRVGWMIENHLPWGIRKPGKIKNLVNTMRPFAEVFFNVLLSDQHGRLSDNQEEKLVKVHEWIDDMVVNLAISEIEEVNEEKKIFVLIGASGSGKTTYVNDWVKEHSTSDHHVFSYDGFVEDWYLTDEEKEDWNIDSYRLAFARRSEDENFFNKANAEFMNLIKGKQSVKNVFIDNTNTTVKNRRFFVEEGRKHGYAIIGVVFQNDLRTLEYRTKNRKDKVVPLEVINRQYNKTTLPSYGEVDRIEFGNPLMHFRS